MLRQVSARARPGRLPGLLALTAALLLAPIPVVRADPASETPGGVFPASTTGGGAFADAGTAPPLSISDNGRFLAFVSGASNLSPNAPAGDAEVYVKDLATGGVELASRGNGAAGPPAEPEPIGEHPARQIEDAILSADGRYLVFASTAHNLVPGLPLAAEVTEEIFFPHVYRRDLQSGETELVDRVTGAAGPPVAAEARAAAISANGRFVLFDSRVEDLEDPAGSHQEGQPTLYLRDLQTGTTTAVGRATDAGGQPGALADQGSLDGDITPDGRYILFSSTATNLDPRANGFFQVYRRDLQSGQTVAVSVSNPTASAPDGALGDGESFEPIFLGADGCRVAFVALGADNLYEGGGAPPASATYVRDLCAAPPRTTLASLDSSGGPFAEAVPAGADGAGVLLLKAAGPAEASHLYLRDLGAGTTTLLDRAGATGPIADQGVEGGALADNGCRAAFSSGADNLTPDPPPASGSSLQLQVYVRQLGPCAAPGETGGGGQGQPGSHPADAAGSSAPVPERAARLRILHLGHAALWLRFPAAGRARVRIDPLRGRDEEPAGVGGASLLVRAGGPGAIRVGLPNLSPGRYRLQAKLLGQPARPLTRLLTVAAPG
jgi:WD40-like Beta Propeller Repeat